MILLRLPNTGSWLKVPRPLICLKGSQFSWIGDFEGAPLLEFEKQKKEGLRSLPGTWEGCAPRTGKWGAGVCFCRTEAPQAFKWGIHENPDPGSLGLDAPRVIPFPKSPLRVFAWTPAGRKLKVKNRGAAAGRGSLLLRDEVSVNLWVFPGLSSGLVGAESRCRETKRDLADARGSWDAAHRTHSRRKPLCAQTGVCVEEGGVVCWERIQVCFGKPWAVLSRDTAWDANPSGCWKAQVGGGWWAGASAGAPGSARVPSPPPLPPSQGRFSCTSPSATIFPAPPIPEPNSASVLCERLPSSPCRDWESLVANFVCWSRSDSGCRAVESIAYLTEKMLRESPRHCRLCLSYASHFLSIFAPD